MAPAIAEPAALPYAFMPSGSLMALVRMTYPFGPFGTLELDDTPWRSDYLYSRASTIYGGTAEIQRNIIARRLLDLGKE